MVLTIVEGASALRELSVRRMTPPYAEMQPAQENLSQKV